MAAKPREEGRIGLPHAAVDTFVEAIANPFHDFRDGKPDAVVDCPLATLRVFDNPIDVHLHFIEVSDGSGVGGVRPDNTHRLEAFDLSDTHLLESFSNRGLVAAFEPLLEGLSIATENLLEEAHHDGLQKPHRRIRRTALRHVGKSPCFFCATDEDWTAVPASEDDGVLVLGLKVDTLVVIGHTVGFQHDADLKPPKPGGDRIQHRLFVDSPTQATFGSFGKPSGELLFAFPWCNPALHDHFLLPDGFSRLQD